MQITHEIDRYLARSTNVNVGLVSVFPRRHEEIQYRRSITFVELPRNIKKVPSIKKLEVSVAPNREPRHREMIWGDISLRPPQTHAPRLMN
jgi:hypothetical protein